MSRSITFPGPDMSAFTKANLSLRLYGRSKAILDTSAVTFSVGANVFSGVLSNLPDVAGINYTLTLEMEGFAQIFRWPSAVYSDYQVIPQRDTGKTITDFLPEVTENGVLSTDPLTVTESALGGDYFVEGWSLVAGSSSLSWVINGVGNNSYNWAVAATLSPSGVGPIASAHAARIKQLMKNRGVLRFFKIRTVTPYGDSVGEDAPSVPSGISNFCGWISSLRTPDAADVRSITIPADVRATVAGPLDSTAWIRETLRDGSDKPGGLYGTLVDNRPSTELPMSDGVAMTTVHFHQGRAA